MINKFSEHSHFYGINNEQRKVIPSNVRSTLPDYLYKVSSDQSSFLMPLCTNLQMCYEAPSLQLVVKISSQDKNLIASINDRKVVIRTGTSPKSMGDAA